MEMRKKVLLLEKQDNLREILSFMIESAFNFDVVKVTNSTQAIQCLQEIDPIMIIAGDGENKEDGYALFKNYVDLAMFNSCVFTESRSSDRTLSYDDATPTYKFNRENILREILDRIEEAFSIDKEVEEKEYTPVSMGTLPYFDGIQTDLYIMLPTSKRYIKLFKKGDNVTWEDVEKKRDKGVEYLYINQPTYNWILNNIKVLNSHIVNNPSYKINLSIDAEEVLAEFRVNTDVINSVHDKTAKIKERILKSNDLKKFLSSLKITNRRLEFYMDNKIKLISCISCALAKELHSGSDVTYDKLIYAAHMHDILLYRKPALAMIQGLSHFEQYEKLGALNEKDKELFLKHPLVTAEIIEQDKSAPKEAYDIVLQHHEKGDGTGFPHGLNYSRIKFFSAIFIISQDLANYILSRETWTMEEFVESTAGRYKGPSFHKIMRILRKLKIQ